MKCASFLLAAVVTLSAGAVAASPHESHHLHDNVGRMRKAKFHGTVKELPQSGVEGVWQVDEVKVFVNADTKIEEEHGKVALGAYVEVEGYHAEGRFTANEIEIKDSGGRCSKGFCRR